MPRLGRTLVVWVVLGSAVAAWAGPATAAPTPAQDAVAIYGGRGSWLDIFAGPIWQHPAAVVAELKAHAVDTLYLETGNYSQDVDVVRPLVLGRWLRAAHAAGINVVAWYLPSLAHPAVDSRRALAAIRFESASGDRFDGFALDIEASLVHPVALRNARLLTLARFLRNGTPPGYPLGAIIPSPVGMDRHPHYWPGFPYRGLADEFDAFLPMAYFSYYVRTRAGAYDYTRRVVTLLRRRTSDDVLIHLIGGVANRLGPGAVVGFVRAAGECGVDGLSLYAFPQTSLAQWSALDALPVDVSGATACG